MAEPRIYTYQRSTVFAHAMPERHARALLDASTPLDPWPIQIRPGHWELCRTWRHPFEGLFYTPVEAQPA